ncbi:MAG: transketolase C-terminal domain-containing protein, partial [Bacteroidota bacterium]
GISFGHYDLRFLKPLDETLLHQVFCNYPYILTVEDGMISGGMGSALVEFASDNNYSTTIRRIGIPDEFAEHGSIHQLQKECGMDPDSIFKVINEMVKVKSFRACNG